VFDKITEKDALFLRKQSEIYELCDNVPAAIKNLERALLTEKSDINMWIKMAELFRKNYNLPRASIAVTNALALDGGNLNALLECARLRKAQGKLKEYRTILDQLLNELKERNRT
jgi:cytochrome c-type biogenesis protein CcmH/NrfG